MAGQFCFICLTMFMLAVRGEPEGSAIDGGYSDWSKFSECNVSCGRGVKIRKRSCNSPEPRNGGENCSGLGPAMESEACNSFPCPIDGGYSQWSNFTSCTVTCGGGFQSRARTCTNPLPCCGGKNCEHLGPSEEKKECGTCLCDVDGGWSEWCTFTLCSVTCGGGVRYRNRTCTNPPPQSGGQNCLGSASEYQKCNTEPCHDGNYTEWSQWSDCSVTCGGGVQKRTRTCTNPPPREDGRDCKELSLGPAKETQECNPTACSIDGNYTEWSGWSDCSASCGGGLQIRVRSCTSPPPQNDGKNCDGLGPADQKQECNTDLCPIDGNFTEWSDWTDCSVTCGGGSQSRSRKCTNPPPQYGGKNCDKLGPTNQTQECNSDPCPIDGNYTEWSEWSECSVTCDGGFQTRTRQCSSPPPQYGGKGCEELGPTDETQECSTNSCPPPCSAGLDIGIVLDKSKSVKIRNLKKVIASLVELVDKFEPGPDKDHFGLVTFNHKASTEFTFSDETLYSKENLKKRISKIPLKLELQTRTDLAMKEARDKLFSRSGGDRPEKPNIMLFLTDGKPTKQPKPFATFAAEFYKDSKVAGLYTVAVGIGSDINKQTLKEIAGENGNVVTVESFDQLANELGEIKDKVCSK